MPGACHRAGEPTGGRVHLWQEARCPVPCTTLKEPDTYRVTRDAIFSALPHRVMCTIRSATRENLLCGSAGRAARSSTFQSVATSSHPRVPSVSPGEGGRVHSRFPPCAGYERARTPSPAPSGGRGSLRASLLAVAGIDPQSVLLCVHSTMAREGTGSFSACSPHRLRAGSHTVPGPHGRTWLTPGLAPGARRYRPAAV